MPFSDYLLEIIGRLLHVPLDLLLATLTPFIGFHFNDRADWMPLMLVLSSFQILLICRLKCSRWLAAGRLAFAFTLIVACLAPFFMYFADWYCRQSVNINPSALPRAAQSLLNLLLSGDMRLASHRYVCAYCYGWTGWSVNTCFLFFILGWKQMTKRQRTGSLLLFLLPWVAYELFFSSPLRYLLS